MSRGRRVRLEASQHLPAVDAGQADVEDDSGRAAPPYRGRAPSTPSRAAVTRDRRARQVGRQQVERRPVVLDDDDRRPRRSRPAVRRAGGSRRRPGSRSRTCCPTPTSLSSHIRPPSSSTIRRDSVRPRPVPSSLEAPRPPCWKDSKIRSRSSRGTPMPVSVTVIASSVPSRRRATDDRAAVGGELHRVGEQVEHHLLEPQLVGVDRRRRRRPTSTRSVDAVQRRPLADHRRRVRRAAAATSNVA